MKYFAPILIVISLLLGASTAVEFNRAQTGKITHLVGKILEQAHYRQTALDDALSENFLRNYLNALDYNHMIFLQSDVDDFKARYNKTLDNLVRNGDSTPAFKIFELFLVRLTERQKLVDELLKENFDFASEEMFLPSRNKSPWPKDESEAHALWRARIKYELLQGRLAKEKPEETAKTISRRYHRLERTMREFDSEEVLQTYLTALAHVYDPHSDYLSPTEASNFDIHNISLSLSGIGAQLEWDDGYTKIKSLIPGGPADLSKQLKPNDRIVAVAQGDGEAVDVVDMRLNKVVNMIRGKRGTEVRLTILPADTTEASVKKVVPIVRDEIKLKEQFAKAKIVEQSGDQGTLRLGVVNLPQFYDNCTAHVEKLVARMKQEGIDGLVLDLRRNGGGILDEAVALTGLFVKKAPVVQVKDHMKRTEIKKDDDNKVLYEGPLVVLVGRMSASASEIVAAALQDYGRAVIVGDQATHGKGTVQTILSLDQFLRGDAMQNPGKLKFTVSKFYRVAGGTTQKQGVQPDIILPSPYDYLEIGEASLENSLPPDQTAPLEYPTFPLVKPYLTDLRDHSSARIKTDRDFGYLLEDIEQLKKRQQDKRISLNEKTRLEEQETQKATNESRKKERAQRQARNERVFEISIDMIEKNEPLTPFAAVKQKENDALAAVSKPAAADEDPEAESEENHAIDAPLNETLQILRDYSGMLKKQTAQSSPKNLLLQN